MRFFTSRQQPKTAVNPADYILSHQPAVELTRDGDGVRVTWREKAVQVTLFGGPTPRAIDWQTPLQTISDSQSVTLNGASWQTAVQPAVGLRFTGGPWDGRELVAAERILPFNKLVNFRDVGGYLTANGRQVRWGKLYRSSRLSEATEADLAKLQALNVQLICDFRSLEEQRRAPDPDLPAWERHSLPVESLDRRARLRMLGTLLFRRSRLPRMVREGGYVQVMLEENGRFIGDTIKLLVAEPERVGVAHCTAGKDRTGVLVALILSYLGVPDETILADYSISNRYYALFRRAMEPDLKPLLRFGITVDDLWPVLIVDPENIRHVMTHVRQNYGSVETYLLQKTGVSPAELDALRAQLLI